MDGFNVQKTGFVENLLQRFWFENHNLNQIIFLEPYVCLKQHIKIANPTFS